MSNDQTNKLFGRMFIVVLILLFSFCFYEVLQTDRGGAGDTGGLIEAARQESAAIGAGISKAEERSQRIEAGAEHLEIISEDSARIIEQCQRILSEAKTRGTTEE